MKGIILAGGIGTRLDPATRTISKQMLPIYDKPMIYYPLSVLMLARIREILIISTERDLPFIKGLLGDGSQFGLSLSYLPQNRPEGIAQAFLIGEQFIKNSSVMLVLGDNVFYGGELAVALERARDHTDGAKIFCYRVRDPQRYGVAEINSNGHAISLEEKPENPKSPWAVTGLYMYDDQVAELTKKLKPSPRGELEITDLNRMYLDQEKLEVELLGRGVAWLDTGTPDSLLEASQFVQTLEKRQGLKICCPEEIALNKGLLSKEAFQELVGSYPNGPYRDYLKKLDGNFLTVPS